VMCTHADASIRMYTRVDVMTGRALGRGQSCGSDLEGLEFGS